MDGVLDFIDTADMTLMNRQEHTKVTDLAWDSTGRYVVSSLSYWTEKVGLFNICSIVLTFLTLYADGHRICCLVISRKTYVSQST